MILDPKRRLSFTCCDIEPAVLARNVVLFSLISDTYPAAEAASQDHDCCKVVWNLFYHMFIPRSSLDILRNQATKLSEASKSYDSWLSSPYGKFISFIDRHTLLQLRQSWVQYAFAQDDDQTEIRARRAIAKTSQKMESSIILHGLRSAGPLWANAMDTMAHAYRSFWQTGVAGGNPDDLKALGNEGKGLINPMFAVSSAPAGDFVVHYGTDPLLGFHVAEAFAGKFGSQKTSVTERANQVVEVAKNQFHDWCSAFKAYVEKERVIIRFFCGDALALCHELQVKLTAKDERSKLARAYVKPWSSCPLILDGLAEGTTKETHVLFDVIDTSNLGDHVGLINILSASAPLLRQNSSAVLYTESLLVASSSIEKQLPLLLGSDIATFSLLLGLAPVGYLAGVTCEAVGNETALFHMLQQNKTMRQYRMRIPWVSPELLVPAAIPVPKTSDQKMPQITLAPIDLALYLSDLYKNMFSHENLQKLVSQMQRMSVEHRSTDIQRYTRAGFVAFLRVVKRRVNMDDWNKTINLLLNEIETDRSLLLGTNSLQELYAQLHLFDLFTSSALEADPRKIRGIGLPLRKNSQDKGFLAQGNIPPIVHIVLVVPRKKIETFTNMDPDSVGTPAMHLSIRQISGPAQYENLFYSFHCFFGKRNYMDGIDTFKFDEDEKGWLGNQDLIVSCPVPAFGLLAGPRDGIRVSLRLNNTPENLMRFSLGPTLSIHETGLDYLWIGRDSPGLNSVHALSMQKRWIEMSSSKKSSAFSVRVKMSGHQASHVHQHVDFVQGSTESKALADGANVTVAQCTPCTALLHIGKSHSQRLSYPFCIKATQSTVRIARKSSWIEVEVPISSAVDIGGDYWTQVTLEYCHPPRPWSIPHVNLSIQPKLCFDKKAKSSSWLNTFLGTGVSDAERATQKVGGTATPRFDFKESLATLFASFAGQNPKCGPMETFQLTVNGSCHTILFADSIRQDLDLGSIVMDAYIVPLTISRVHKLSSALTNLTGALGVRLSKEESVLWKSLLPALAERCRTWSHKTSCEYRNKGVPLSTADDQTPLCSCGEGEVDANFYKNRVWRPFARYATRIAIMPVFPVPYLESSMSDFKADLNTSAVTDKGSSSLRTMEEQKKKTPGDETSQAPKCDFCGKTDTPLKNCAACGKAKYCGYACQKAAWREHKKDCAKK